MQAIKYDGTRDCAAEIAEAVCALFDQGQRGDWTFNGVPFELTDIARCSEFVRECCEAAAGRSFHGSANPCYCGATARETEQRLSRAGKRVLAGKRGDIVCFNRGNAGEWGHIGLCLGGGLFAENTSSTRRGPGFVISRLSDMTGRVSGYYEILPARKVEQPQTETLRIVSQATGKVLASYQVVPNGNHYDKQRKIYVAEEE